MSRLQGRVEDVNSISKYLIENYNKVYIPSFKEVGTDELMDAPKKVFPYLSKDSVQYINDCNIQLCWNGKLAGTIYSSAESDENVIFFRTKQMREEYKTDLVYYIGDLLGRKNNDIIQDQYDISCQYNSLLPLLIEYLYLKEEGKEDVFSDRNISDLRMNAKEYRKIYEKVKLFPFLFSEENLLNNTLLYLIPLSSLDATYQIIDNYGNDKDKLIYLIQELIDNENHNREEIINKNNINTYGFKRLRKEIDLRK